MSRHPVKAAPPSLPRMGEPAEPEILAALRRHKSELQRANRALRTRSSCNQALIHATTEESLLAEVCRVIVEEGGYRLA